MAWLWTDELAHLLIEQDGADPELFAGWTERPYGIRVDEPGVPIETARRLAEGLAGRGRGSRGRNVNRDIDLA